MLDRIEIEGFKSIRQMVLDLRPVNVLIGANGAGKSNFIGVFVLLQRMMEGRLQLHVAQAGGADTLLHFGRKQTSELRLRLRYQPDKTFYRVTLVPSAHDALIYGAENYGVDGGFGFHSDGFGVQTETGLLAGLPGQAGQHKTQVHQVLAGVRVHHFHDTSAAAKVKQSQDINDNEALRSDASNLAAFLFLLREKHPDSYRRLVATVRLAAPFFDDFRLRPSPFNEQKILLEWSERGSDAYFNAHALSDGTLRFICLATLLLQPAPPPLIIIDEPELGLHPYAIQLLADLVSSASEKSQVILSTQSVTLVNQFAPEDLVVVDRSGKESLFRRLSPEETQSWLDSYSLGELWEKNVIGGRPG
ncbi:AAA family ATPase [Pyxidicoccus fallax]|uniref:AAA family ATPase n=1 Tax=Pyxidicoccus fallax TaxID=394095 RepID=A0A848LZE1_9BACT|nr:AAA family ATPase [Pyxidicoccus fallax]NMO22991.1 AAA family ATPase [Pyxidicoccus fallax]NPC85489.1 AAA family ATPase [Pyxidicoccus fallax]